MSSITKTTPVQGTHMMVAIVDADGDYVGHETHLINCDCTFGRLDRKTRLRRTATGFPVATSHPAWIERAVDGPCLQGAHRRTEIDMNATVTTAQAERVAARTAAIVERMRADADAAEAKGDTKGAAALRQIADSRERAGAKVRTGARVVSA